jgi:Major Facilitator Superfamily
MSEQTSASPLGRPAPIYLPIGILAVLLGGLLSTLNGRLLTVALPDLRGALGLSVDEGAWIPTAYNMAIMFIGVFSVYLGALLGARRVLLACSALYAVASLLMPFASGYRALLVLQVIAGLTSGTFYPLTLSFIFLQICPRVSFQSGWRPTRSRFSLRQTLHRHSRPGTQACSPGAGFSGTHLGSGQLCSFASISGFRAHHCQQARSRAQAGADSSI